MNYEILISISLGDNLPLDDEFLSKECKTFAILEAKFNDEVLQSDPIELQSSNPELATELGFRLHKKDFQQFRIERKSIKLQCYVEYSTLPERHFIGYVILHLRDAQEYSNDAKYKWLVLLNPKYKGTSTKRPQLYLAFMVNKLADGDNVDESDDQSHLSESQFSRSFKKEKMLSISNTENCFVSSMDSNDFDSNLKVKFQNKFFYIWDENSCNESDCNQLYLINVQIDNPLNLKNLFGDKLNDNSNLNFYFKYTLFGQQIKTSIFRDLFNCQDFRKHKLAFPILTYDKKVMKHYFDSYPTIEIQFCNTNQKLIGFITINLLRLFQKASLPIDADYMIVPEDESVYVREPFPTVNLCISITKKDYSQSLLSKLQFKESAKTETSSLEVDSLNSKHQLLLANHYYIAIDLRTIQLNSPNADNCEILFHPFYLQFSYAFFGVTDQIKTYPAISFIPENPHNAITIPHGFCGFNFATTKEKLHYSFMNIPLIVQLIMQKDDTLLGTAEIDLSCLLDKYYEADNSLKDLSDNFINTAVQVHDELNEKICEIQVVMFLQEIQNSDKSNDINVKLKEISNSLLTKDDTGKTTELFKKLNDAILDNTQDIELWKEEQRKLFKNRLKQKETEFLSNLQNDETLNAKLNSLKELENKLKISLEKLSDREKLLTEREHNIDARQSELDHKFLNLNKEIDEAIHEVRIQYEEKANVHKNKIKILEQEKYRCQEKVYQFERRLKEKDYKIKELESKIFELNQNSNRRLNQQQQQRATSLTRSVINCPRKIVITRDCHEPNMAKSMIENRSTNSMASKPPAPTHIQLKSRIVPPSTNSTSRSVMSSSFRSPSPSLKNDTSLIDKIKKERQELIKKGVSLNDPLIVEIDKRLRNFRLQSSKRI